MHKAAAYIYLSKITTAWLIGLIGRGKYMQGVKIVRGNWENPVFRWDFSQKCGSLGKSKIQSEAIIICTDNNNNNAATYLEERIAINQRLYSHVAAPIWWWCFCPNCKPSSSSWSSITTKTTGRALAVSLCPHRFAKWGKNDGISYHPSSSRTRLG